MHHDVTDQPQELPPLQSFELTYSPAHHPSGTPLDNTASRQVLAQRLTRIVVACSPQGAIDAFERRAGRMVTGCMRLQEDCA